MTSQTFHFDVPKRPCYPLGLGEASTAREAAVALSRALTGPAENCGLPHSIQVSARIIANPFRDRLRARLFFAQILAVVPAPSRDFHARESCFGKRYIYSIR